MSIAAVNAPLAGRLARPAGTVVSAGGVDFGGLGVVAIAGPCAVEDGPALTDLALRLRASRPKRSAGASTR